MNGFDIESLAKECSSRARIAFRFGKTELKCYMVTLNEEKRYGIRKIERRTTEGRPIEECYMSVDRRIFPGRVDLPGGKTIAGGLKSVTVDEDGNHVSYSSVLRVAVDDGGFKILERYPSGLYSDNYPVFHELDDLITIDDVLDIDVKHVYVLFPIEGQEQEYDVLKDFLRELELKKPPSFPGLDFTYRRSYTLHRGFLQLVAGHVFLEIGKRRGTRYLRENEEIEEIDEEDVDIELEFGY